MSKIPDSTPPTAPVRFEYSAPDEAFLAAARAGSQAEILHTEPGIRLESRYFQQGIPGAKPELRLRAFVAERLRQAARSLAPNHGLVVLDAYRSRETQAGLFADFQARLGSRHPDWDPGRLAAETRKFVAHPDEPGRFRAPPHLTGGAFDVSLTGQGEILDLGTEFDDLTERAATDFFETATAPAELIFRDRRRRLFHALRAAGFTNWPHEWWHYDLGNDLWAQVTGQTVLYGAMEISPPSRT